jgi:hypothetical protein
MPVETESGLGAKKMRPVFSRPRGLRGIHPQRRGNISRQVNRTYANPKKHPLILANPREFKND